MTRYAKYTFCTILIALMLSCRAGLRTAPSASPGLTIEPTSSSIPSPALTSAPANLTITPVPGTPTPLPTAGSIVPTLQDVPDIPNSFADKLRLFLGEETILMASSGIVAIHPGTGATLKLEEDIAAWFPNSTSTSPLSPDGEWIVYAIGGQRLVLLNTSTADRKLFTLPGVIQSLAWLPDSQHLLLNVAAFKDAGYARPSQIRPNWLFYFDVETDMYTILRNDFRPHIEAVSPDGKSFLYYNHGPTEDLTDPVDLILQPVSGDSPIQLTDDMLSEFWVDLTLDGQSLVVFAYDPTIPFDPKALPCHWRLDKAYLLNIKTNERRDYPITGKNAVYYARLSPDGKKVAYVNAEGDGCAENFPVYILDLERGENERLDIGGFHLDWSPDGSKLVFIQYSPEFQGHYRRLVIYDLASHQIAATYYITETDQEAVTPYWVRLR